jgi:hypothetical protein
VISGVNVRQVGALSVFGDALASLVQEYGDEYEIVALVKSRDLFDVAGVTYLEFPRIMYSWLSRLRFEYWSARELSAQLKPKLWLSMHDMTPEYHRRRSVSVLPERCAVLPHKSFWVLPRLALRNVYALLPFPLPD